MLTQGAIDFIFRDSPVPLYVQVQTSAKYSFLQDEERVINQCYIYDGIQRRQIKIKSQYTFFLQQEQPQIQIRRLGYLNGERCIEEYCVLYQQLIPYNINQYYYLKPVIFFTPNMVNKFGFINNCRINIKGKLNKTFKQYKASNLSSFKIATILDCLSEQRATIMSFQSDWNGGVDLRLDDIGENQECVYLNILTYEYSDPDGKNEIRYRIDKETQIFPLTISWTEYNQINVQNLGRIFNVFGLIFKIRNIQGNGYQEITIVNFQKQKVKVIIQLPFAQEFQLEKNKWAGFRMVKVIQKHNSCFALSFNDESKLCKDTQVEPPIDFQNQSPPLPHVGVIELPITNTAQVLENTKNNKYFRIQTKVQQIKLINLDNEYAIKVLFENDLSAIVKKRKYIIRILGTSIQKIQANIQTVFKVIN
ncbi:unnamed protein product (macronuclear) [Paramecium tetraurelia]|uniref:Uncharacterized protein n=1 Tax=Paramecium tetraurelia TaxID=5888 RepID=A0C4K8_PARTE|nr:uncharacterized protein GSPATT00006224001 [Paramecium tetraurelia]CAK65725.1 unnamed protein product [Paramecium tetraurelia]|eukprot:XP_001433122.1 hypothetical protein (macronuclear) [Paramecium tetraurelia strain d4-2]